MIKQKKQARVKVPYTLPKKPLFTINLITKHEQEQLDKLRTAHQFYLDNKRKSLVESVADMHISLLNCVIEINKMVKIMRGLTNKET